MSSGGGSANELTTTCNAVSTRSGAIRYPLPYPFVDWQRTSVKQPLMSAGMATSVGQLVHCVPNHELVAVLIDRVKLEFELVGGCALDLALGADIENPELDAGVRAALIRH